jgi:DNA helicase-2/ATP-dependent DNA helicase PcrA
MEAEFQRAYKELNKAQEKAVNLTDGPLLVIAGPGTGKTQLLSLRVANILRKTDTDASSVLCLTFTNFAATNMRERLSKLVGNAARDVKVKTFHSFAAELMQLYPDYFWNGASLTIVPDAVQLDIIQTILAELPLDHPLAIKFAGQFTAINHVKEALKLTKEAGLTPDKLRAMIEVNQAYIDLIEPLLAEILEPSLSFKKLDSLLGAVMDLPDQPIEESIKPLRSLSSVLKSELKQAIEDDQATNKTKNTGKWKKKWVQGVGGEKGMFDERKRNDWWMALADVYETYRNTLHSLGYYDYSDMIVEVISGLEQDPELLAKVQENFLYVLIDEFQDTNPAQLRLAHLVASSSVEGEEPNLMAVGDDDQSIFAFNGAELNNMYNFEHSYKTAEIVVLTDNYRSTQSILDMSSSIIDMADDRLIKRMPKLDKKLLAVTDVEEGRIERYVYPTREHQLKLLADRIKDDWESDDTQSLAVLARGHDSLRQLSYYLHEIDVPIRYEKQNNVLDQELIIQLELLSRIVVAIADGNEKAVNFGLSRLLTHPAWQVNPRDLWKLATDNYKNRTNWLTSLAEHEDTNLSNLADWLFWLSGQASLEPLAIMMDYLIGLRAGQNLTSPLRDHYLSMQELSSTYLESLSGLSVMQGLVKEFIGQSTGSPKLIDFVKFMELNRSLGRQIVDESWFVSGDRAVELMTVHKAKGLEFDTVYLLDANDNLWQPKRIGRKSPANLPLQSYGEHYDDYVRLAYVAATRSRRSFIVSSYSNDAKGQKTLASPLFESLKVSEMSIEDSSEVNQLVLESSLSWPRLDMSDEKALLQPRLEDYKLSATGLLRFLDLSHGGPAYFLEKDLLRLPDLTTDSMAYGTAIHSALQAAQNLTNEDDFDLQKVLAEYEKKLASLQMQTSSFEKYLGHGHKLLLSLFDNPNFTFTKGGQAEVSINDIQFNNVPLSGTLDHVLVDGDTLIISDYKTGNALYSFDTKAQDKAIKAWRHKTQLLFYCLLIKHSGRFRNIKHYKARMVYVEAEDPKHLILELNPDPADIKRLEELVTAVWNQIKSVDFAPINITHVSIADIQEFEDKLIAN